MIFSKVEILDYIASKEKTLIDPYYEQSMKIDEAIQETFEKKYPKFLGIQRPNETESQKKYRKDYFEEVGNPVKGFLSQIERQVEKVFISEEFNVSYSSKERKVSEESDRLKTYLEDGYYNGKSFVNSFKETIKSRVLKEPNSLALIIPRSKKKENSYREPYLVYAKAENVKFYRANEAAIVLSETKSDVIDLRAFEYIEGERVYQVKRNYGKIYWFIDLENIWTATHTHIDEEGIEVYDFISIKHLCTSLPAIKLGSKILESKENGHELRTSELEDVQVFLRNAIMDFMDLVVEHNFHVASQEWAVAYVDCNTCRGIGTVKGEGKPAICGTCNGNKKVPPSSGGGLDKIIIPMGSNEFGSDSSRLPSQIGGFIARPETGSRIFKESFDSMMASALQPFGLEHLTKVPLNQSGAAKDYDMQEGYSFLLSMSNHIGNILSMNLMAINSIRYGSSGKDVIDSEEVIVTMPVSFNLSSSVTISKKLENAINYKLPNAIVGNYTLDLLAKEYGTNSLEYKTELVRIQIDPLPYNNYNQKLLSRNLISDLQYILTNNIDAIMFDLIRDNKDFLSLDSKAQKSKAYKYATLIYEEAKTNLDSNFVYKTGSNIINEDQSG